MRHASLHRYWLSGLVLALTAFPAAAAHAGVVGSRFAVSNGKSSTMPENQPQVAFGNGKYLVVYTHWGTDSLNQPSADIYGVFINRPTSRINTFPIDDYDSSSTHPTVAYDPINDRYLLAYEDKRSYPDPDLYIRLLDGTGLTLAEQYIASSNDYERMPDVAYIGNGTFMVVWSSTTNPNLPTDSVIKARTVSYLEPDFVFGDEQVANVGTPFVGMSHPRVTANAFGQSLVVWQWPSSTAEATTDQWVYAIQARALDATGAPLGTVATLSTGTDSQTLPSVAYDPSNDQFCVVWQSLTPDGDHDILGSLATIASGQAGATTSLGIAMATQDDSNPAVSWNMSKHEFQVLWEAAQAPQNHDIYACAISPAGVVETEFAIAQSTDMETSPALARGNGQFLTVWEDDPVGVNTARIYGAFLYDVAPPPHVTGTSPALVTVQNKVDGASQILVDFDMGVQISQADVTVQGLLSGAHNNFTLTYNSVGRFATLTWPSPLVDDTFLVTVKDTVAGSTNGLSLDGEMDLLLPGFPSGDGVAGGNFQGLVYRLVGDINGDRSVDIADLLIFASTWGLNGADPGFDTQVDLNNDNRINVVDLLILADHWGNTIPVGP